MKVLFLDFDGVINSRKFFEANKAKILKCTSLFTRAAAEIDPMCLNRVKHITTVTGADIVVSSSWRILHSLVEIKSFIREAGWSHAPIIGKTHVFSTMKERSIRGDEVADWLTRRTVEAYAILDDDEDFHTDQPLVRTSWNTGITDEQAEEVIQILGRKS